MKTFKSIKKYSALFFLFAVSACQSLDESPEGFVSPTNFYTTIGQGEAALTGSMNQLWDYWSGYSYGYGSFIHDDQLLDGDLNIASNFANDLWNIHYRALNNINGVLRAVNAGSIKGVDQSNIDLLVAQARFLRAYNYFMLVRLYGDLPLITEDTPDPVTTSVETRTPIAEVYDLITSDFLYAVEKLPASWDGAPGKPSAAAAKGLLAKVYLTMATAPLNQTENYAKARDMAADLMDDGTHSLVPNVYDVFKPENKYGPEMIWSFNSTADDPATDPQIWAPSIMEGWGDASIDPEWSDRWFTKSPNEPRQDAYLILEYNGTPYTEFDEQRPFIRKYMYISDDEYNTYQSRSNFPIIRYADVLLIYAEAVNMAAGGPTAEAYEAVNQIRRRAFNVDLNSPSAVADLPAGLSQTAFDNAVIEERNMELSFEYDRWFDIVRKRLLPTIFADRQDILTNFSEEDYLYPIPLFDARTLGSQNPGYAIAE
jgi:starch-binding outer membrane protein, SusD/RagB family